MMNKKIKRLCEMTVKEKYELFLRGFMFLIASLGLGLAIYITIIHVSTGRFSLETEANRLLQDDEIYYYSGIVTAGKGAVFIGYNCSDSFITDCAGRKVIFFERTEEGWTEVERRVIW